MYLSQARTRRYTSWSEAPRLGADLRLHPGSHIQLRSRLPPLLPISFGWCLSSSVGNVVDPSEVWALSPTPAVPTPHTAKMKVSSLRLRLDSPLDSPDPRDGRASLDWNLDLLGGVPGDGAPSVSSLVDLDLSRDFDVGTRSLFARVYTHSNRELLLLNLERAPFAHLPGRDLRLYVRDGFLPDHRPSPVLPCAPEDGDAGPTPLAGDRTDRGPLPSLRLLRRPRPGAASVRVLCLRCVSGRGRGRGRRVPGSLSTSAYVGTPHLPL